MPFKKISFELNTSRNLSLNSVKGVDVKVISLLTDDAKNYSPKLN